MNTVVSSNENTNTNSNTNTNTNVNTNLSESSSDSNIVSNNTNQNVNTNNNINDTQQQIYQEIQTPPPSAIAPSLGTSFSQDLCTTGISGAFQGQLFGLSGGKSVRDMNCERIKLSKTIYDMGMKVAAVSLMCQDDRVFMAMEMAGTPCPYMGQIGTEATESWQRNPQDKPDGVVDVATRFRDGDRYDYRVWSKEEFCEESPDEDICKS
jgi:hypothetical protein